MIKLVALLKRRAGMSTEEFAAYYESKHAKLAEGYLRGNAVRYFRRYLHPIAHPLAGLSKDPAFDVLVEMWFEDTEQFRSTMGLFSAPDAAEILAADEKRLFDVERTIVFTVDERESDIAAR